MKCSLSLRELKTSNSYVKCCEGSVVWGISKMPHEGIRTSESNIICVHPLLMERGACESSFPASLYRCVDPAGRRRSGEELLWSSGQDMGPVLLYRPGAAQISVS